MRGQDPKSAPESFAESALSARDRLAAGSEALAGAIARLESLLGELNLGVRRWLLIATRPLKGGGSSRRLQIFLGYSDEPDGTWAFRLRASDPAGRMPVRYLKLSRCPVSIQARMLPWIRRLAWELVSGARRAADLLEEALRHIPGAAEDRP